LKKQLYLEQLQKRKQISLPTSKGDGRAALDPSTADDQLELIPPNERKAAEQAGDASSVEGESPPDGVFRDKGPILLLVGPPGVGKT
jgi:ATP-dependent Lon protease